MTAVSPTEFAKNFGLYRERAEREPIAIAPMDLPAGYFISPAEFEELQRLRARAGRAYTIENLPPEIADGIAKASMDPAHEGLNALLDD